MKPFEDFVKSMAGALADDKDRTQPHELMAYLAGAVGGDPAYMVYLAASMYVLWKNGGWPVGWKTRWILGHGAEWQIDRTVN